jgi:hypothetical protein
MGELLKPARGPAAGIADYSFDQLQADMFLGYLYTLWLVTAALMETDIQIIRDVGADKGSTLKQRVRHQQCACGTRKFPGFHCGLLA